MANENQQKQTVKPCLFINMFEIAVCLNSIDTDIVTEMQQNSHITETISLVRLKSQKEKHKWMDHLLNTAAQDLMKMNVRSALSKVGMVRLVLDEKKDTMANKMQYYIMCIAYLQMNKFNIAWTMGAICQGTKDMSSKAKEMDIEIDQNFRLIEAILSLSKSEQLKMQETTLANMWKAQKKDRLEKESHFDEKEQ